MCDDPELPLLRTNSPINSSHPSILRKRSRRSSNSSDVPIFSSDDLAEASCENYVSPRRKKQYRRPWWADDASGTRKRRNRQASREFKDSGVWLSSDSSNDDGFSMDSLHLRKVATAETVTNSLSQPSMLQPEVFAQMVIQECLESGRETVDLTSCGITDLSDDIIRPLQHLIRQPNIDSRIEKAYHSFQPSIQLFLASNQLYSLPSEMFNLTNISVLSLRNTRISILPPKIGNLVNLKELNVAGNELRYLPREIVDLMRDAKLSIINAWPNPFFHFSPSRFKGQRWEFPKYRELAQSWAEFFAKELSEFQNSEFHCPEESLYMTHAVEIYRSLGERVARINDDHQSILVGSTRTDTGTSYSQISHGNEDLQISWRASPIFISRTPIALLEVHGSPSKTCKSAPSDLPGNSTVLPATDPDGRSTMYQESNDQTKVRSLFELALGACMNSPYFQELKVYLPFNAPATIEKALELAHVAKIEGGRWCSICKRKYIVPRTEWIEYWHVSPRDSDFCLNEELFLPFLSRGCCWTCRPE